MATKSHTMRYCGLRAPDPKVAKNAVSKAAKSLRNLLEKDEDKLDVLVQYKLLRDKNPKSISKELQETVMQEPALFWVLLREIENFADGAEAAKKLAGKVDTTNGDVCLFNNCDYCCIDNCPPKDHENVVLGEFRDYVGYRANKF